MERKEQLSHEDRVLLFGPSEGNSADRAAGRAVAQQVQDLSALGADASVGKNPTGSDKFNSRVVAPTQLPFVEDLSMEARYILFPPNFGDASLIYDNVVKFTRNTTPNSTAFPVESKVLGYVFHEVRYAFYCLQILQHADGLVLSCQLQSGFAPVLTPFWNAVKDSLAASGLIESEVEEEIDMDFDNFFADSDDDGESFSLDLSIPENKFLELRSDPTLVEEWIQDIQDPNFSQDTLLQLAYNLENVANLEFLMLKFHQQLFEAVVYSLTDAIDLALPGIRCACLFLDAVAQHTTVKVSEENINLMICQLARWTVAQTNTTTITHSKEIADSLSKNLLKFYEDGTQSLTVREDLLKTIHRESPYPSVKQNLNRFLSAIRAN